MDLTREHQRAELSGGRSGFQGWRLGALIDFFTCGLRAAAAMESPEQVSCRHRNTFVSFDLIRSVSCAARGEASKQRWKLKGRGESVILVGD